MGRGRDFGGRAESPHRGARFGEGNLGIIRDALDRGGADRARGDRVHGDGARGELERFVASFPASVYADNAYYYLVRTDLALGDCASARAAFQALAAAFPTSAYVAKAESSLVTAGCP